MSTYNSQKISEARRDGYLLEGIIGNDMDVHNTIRRLESEGKDVIPVRVKNDCGKQYMTHIYYK